MTRSNLNVPQRTLTDIRDSKTYRVRKLADGNIWMTQNLALGSGSGAITLHSYDSDVSSDWVLPQAQTSGSDAWVNTNVKHLYATNNTTYGNYYNWFTATAGTGLDTMSSPEIASSSICARGWQLPNGGESLIRSFYALDLALGGPGNNSPGVARLNKYINAPQSFPYSGVYNNLGVRFQGSVGYWWTRSVYAAGVAHSFSITTDGVQVRNSNSVGNGWTVRCIAK